MKMKLNIKGKEYEVEILEDNGGKVKIMVGGKEFNFEKEKTEEGEINIAQTSLPKRDFSQKEIKAPISGIISQIFVQKEDFIKKGTKILLLSAMKMENEIISDFDGKIEKILIQKGQKVQQGDKLLILK